MTARYCDFGLDFANPANVGDATGTPAQGPGGFQSMIEGWGLHDALAAGDILYAKGTGDLSKLVKITVDVDKTGTWVISDVVQNFNDGGGASGDDWVGELVFIDATTVWVQINDASSDIDLVDIADGIDNTTQTEQIPGANMTAVVCPGIQCDNAAGALGNRIKVIGVNSSWVEDGTQAKLDALGKATNCLQVNAKDYWDWYNLDFDDATEDDVTCSTDVGYDHRFINCDFHDAAEDGIGNSGGQSFNGPTFVLCRFHDNVYGSGLCVYAHYVLCSFYDNSTTGVLTFTGSLCLCLFWDNLIHNHHMSTHSLTVCCTSDDAGASNDGHLYATGASNTSLLNRLTGTGVGLKGDNEAEILDLYNFNNTTLKAIQLTVHQQIRGVNTRLESGVEGYEDAANDLYNLILGAAGYRTEIDLGGSNYVRAARGLPTSILPLIGGRD